MSPDNLVLIEHYPHFSEKSISEIQHNRVREVSMRDDVTHLLMGQRGTVTLPADLREKYRLEPGEVLTLVDLAGVFVLAPKVSVVTKMAQEIEAMREEAGVSPDEILGALREERRRLYRGPLRHCGPPGPGARGLRDDPQRAAGGEAQPGLTA